MLRSSLTVLVGLTLAIGACGGDDDGGGGGSGFNTSVDKSKPVDMLSASETATLCMDFSKWGESASKDLKPKICKLAGLLAGEDKMACEKAVSDCIKEPDEPSEDMCEAPENCSASVGEVQKCLNDSVSLFSSYLDKFPSCAQIASGNGSVPTSTPEQPASCKAIESKCPEIANMFEDDLGEDEDDQSSF